MVDQMNLHLFCSIDELFLPNKSQYRARQETISMKKLAKGNAGWSNTRTVLGWAIDTVNLVYTLL